MLGNSRSTFAGRVLPLSCATDQGICLGCRSPESAHYPHPEIFHLFPLLIVQRFADDKNPSGEGQGKHKAIPARKSDRKGSGKRDWNHRSSGQPSQLGSSRLENFSRPARSVSGYSQITVTPQSKNLQ